MIKQLEELAAFGKGNVEALVQSGTLAAKGAEELAKAYAALSNQNIERANAAAKALTGAKSPVELLQLQARLTRESADTLASEARKIAEILYTVINSALEPLQARARAASELYNVAA